MLTNSLEQQTAALLAEEEETMFFDLRKDDDFLLRLHHFRTVRTTVEKKTVSDPVSYAYAPATPQLISAFGAVVSAIISFQVSVFVSSV